MRQENERLKGIMARIESYDVVVCNNLNVHEFQQDLPFCMSFCLSDTVQKEDSRASLNPILIVDLLRRTPTTTRWREW